MSLERKDVRAKLDPDLHAALSVLAEVDQVDIGEFIERELVQVIQRRVHAASLIAEKCARLGIAGIRPPATGKNRETNNGGRE